MKTDLFQSCGLCWDFQMCWHIECSTFTASSFRIWNSSTGLPSPPLALFVVMLSKAHLTSHSRVSGSRWVITIVIIWVLKIFFVQFFCVFLPPLLNIFCFCLGPYHPVLYWPIFAWNVPLVSLIFLKRSVVFPILLFSSISLHWSLRKAFSSLLAVLWNSAFRCIYVSFSALPFTSLLSSAICQASSDNHFAFLHFFFGGWFWFLPPSSGTLSDLIHWIYLPLSLYNHKGFDLGHTWMV